MLCKKCCVSLRGLAYFAASTHIVVGAMVFVEFLEDLFSVSQSKLMQKDTINIGTERLVYHWVFFSMGLLIFQAIDRESRTLLKRSTIVFLILQGLTLAVRLRYGMMYSASLSRTPFSEQKPEPQGDIHRGLGLSILATVPYMIILFLYIRRLEKNHSARLFRATFPPNCQQHIPLNSRNIGWYGQTLSSRDCSSSRRRNDGDGHSSTLYSPLNFFSGAGGFSPLVWTNPGPPPPYSDAAPCSDSSPLNRTLPSVHTTQPCSSRAVNVTTTAQVCSDTIQGPIGSEGKILNTSRTCAENNGDPSVVTPLLEDDGDDKSGLEC